VCVSLAGHMCLIMGKENPQNYWFLGIKRDKIPQMECILLVWKMCPCCSSREAQVDLSDRPRFPPLPKFPPPPPQKGAASHSPHGVSKGGRPLLGAGGHHVLARLSPDADLPWVNMNRFWKSASPPSSWFPIPWWPLTLVPSSVAPHARP
jgi:hypothetical protein